MFEKCVFSVPGENGSNKGSSVSLRAQDSIPSKAPSSAQSEASLGEDEPEGDSEAIETNQTVEAPGTPSPPLSPAASDTSETRSSMVKQPSETSWREVTVSGGE